MQVEFDSAISAEAESASPEHAVGCRRASMAHKGETHEYRRFEGGAHYVPHPLNHFSTLPSHSTARNHNAAGIWSCTGQPMRVCSGECGSIQVRGFRCMQTIRQFLNEEDGQDVVEYGLLIATIAIVVLIGVGIFGN